MEGAQAGKQQTDCHSPQYNAVGKGAGNDASLAAAAAHKPEKRTCVCSRYTLLPQNLG